MIFESIESKEFAHGKITSIGGKQAMVRTKDGRDISALLDSATSNKAKTGYTAIIGFIGGGNTMPYIVSISPDALDEHDEAIIVV